MRASHTYDSLRRLGIAALGLLLAGGCGGSEGFNWVPGSGENAVIFAVQESGECLTDDNGVIYCSTERGGTPGPEGRIVRASVDPFTDRNYPERIEFLDFPTETPCTFAYRGFVDEDSWILLRGWIVEPGYQERRALDVRTQPREVAVVCRANGPEFEFAEQTEVLADLDPPPSHVFVSERILSEVAARLGLE